MHNVTVSKSLFGYLDFDIDPFDNFYKFSCEFEEGKLNDQSKAINEIYNIRRQCNNLSKAKIGDFQLEILDFGKYALGMVFIKKMQLKSVLIDEYSIIEDMITRIKEEFKLLIDEKKDFFDEEKRNNFVFKLNRMKFVKNNVSRDLYKVNSMKYCDDIEISRFKFKPIQYVLDNIRKVKEYILRNG
uniref:Uncharacterized protein n=1 Tax=Strongyloides venezuelensis TaxID=75913 RepID=A0A0K0FNG9_STRVS